MTDHKAPNLRGDDVRRALATALFDEHRDGIYRRTDRLFSVLLLAQWLMGIGVALWISPRTWAGTASSVHIHVWTAVLLGGVINLFPIVLASLRPARTSTRHVIAIAQALNSALAIHLSGGRIETHFHIFGSLAFLAFYRDWRVLLSFSAVVTVDHLARGIFWPQSIYGVLSASPWRSFEHAAWVVFEDVFLIRSCVQGVAEMKGIADRQAELKTINAGIELLVQQRTSALSHSELRFRTMNSSLPVGVFELDAQGQVTYLNERWAEMAARSIEEGLGDGWVRSIHPEDLEVASAVVASALREQKPQSNTGRLVTPSGEVRWVHVRIQPLPAASSDEPMTYIGTVEDVTEIQLLAGELQQAQKLESVGRLAAGIAHEINTPIQFIGDNLRFLQTSIQALDGLVDSYRTIADEASAGPVAPESLAAVQTAAAAADLPYLREEVPKAITQSLEGVARVSTIVTAMKDFSHQDSADFAAADLNRALLSTVTVARSEFKYVAEVETDLGELPSVDCNLGALNQVFLNLLVNAAHAIADVVGDSGTKGRIGITTHHEDGMVSIAISDTGGGIPEAIRAQIFDPFFTTKEVGRGTGQGLAIARTIVVGKHGGTLTFDSTLGEGTTFYIRLPVKRAESLTEVAA